MYKYLIRPILFLISPESVHKLIVSGLKIAFLFPFIKKGVKKFYSIPDSKLQRNIAGLTFNNPIGLAAGFDKQANLYSNMSVFGFSFIEIGTITPKPQSGNKRPRSFRLPKDSALINRMGFNNIGVEEAVKNLKKRKGNVIIGGNIGKNTSTPNANAVDDYKYCFTKLYNYVDYFAVNVSCPNISNLTELQDNEALYNILFTIVNIRSNMPLQKPIFLKISPDLTFSQIDDIIDIVKRTQIDGIIATNTTTKRDGLITSSTTVNNIGKGGLSGKPLRKRSTEIIKYISDKTKNTIPIIGVGGIMSTSDAIEKLKAGASLIQLYTGFIYEGPGFIKKINKKILEELN